MRPLNAQSLKKMITYSLFTLFMISTLFFQNCQSLPQKDVSTKQSSPQDLAH